MPEPGVPPDEDAAPPDAAALLERHRRLALLRLRAADEMDRIRAELVRLGAWS